MNADPLDVVALGRTRLRVTRLGLGTAPLASVFWGNTEERAVATASRAVAAGIRLFDTAPLYGLGESEHRLGTALAAADRGQLVVATKAGRLLVPGADGTVEPVFDFSADGARRSVEASLRRLGLDRVDVVHVHDPEDHLTVAVDGAFRALAELRSQGVIGALSVGTNVVATGQFVLDHVDVDVVMVAGRLTLLDRTAADLVTACHRAQVSYLAAGVFNSGVLAAPKPGAWYDYAPAEAGVLDAVGRLQASCAAHGVALRAAALQYPLTVDGVTAEVVGMASPDEVDDNLAALRTPIPDELWRELGVHE
jgi:D-threo-aldose 1-dehydrogenase